MFLGFAVTTEMVITLWSSQKEATERLILGQLHASMSSGYYPNKSRVFFTVNFLSSQRQSLSFQKK